MKILIIGGSGNISWHCVKRFCEIGHDVWVLNRRCTLKTRRSLDEFNIHIIKADMRDYRLIERIFEDIFFDVVIDFICYNEIDAKFDLKIFKNRVKQFIFISSAANYDRRKIKYPITEDSKLGTENWEYVKGKIAAEEEFMKAWHEEKFPVTIIRPGHTYDTLIPEAVGNGDWTNIKRLLNGKPIVIHGDGTNLWTITHGSDMAYAIERLLLNEQAYGEDYHITSNEVMTWNDITQMVVDALNIKKYDVVYIPSQKILQYDYSLGIGIVGHKMWPDIYDNKKIKAVTGGWIAQKEASVGIGESIKWLLEDECRQRVNLKLNDSIEHMCQLYV